MNNIKHFLLNKKSGILFVTLVVLLFGSGCQNEHYGDPAKATAEWTLLGKEKNEGYSSTTDNYLLFSYNYSNQKRKLSIKFGSFPTTNAPLKLVDYFKVPLAANEMIIGIMDDDFYYLSTGTDNITITPSITELEGVRINFNGVRVQRHDTQFNPHEVTTVSGFISQK